MSFPPPITGLKLRVSTGSDTYEQPIPSASLGNNSMQIMPNTAVFNAFNSHPFGTIFTPSIVTSYGSDESGNAVSAVSTPSVVANFVPKQIIPNLSLAAFTNKLTTDSPFSLSVTSLSDGVLTFSSSDTSVATVNSSRLVTIVGAGTTTITVNLAASVNGIYTAASVTRQLVVTVPVNTLSWNQKGGDINGEAAGDQSGYSVSLSSDGTIVAIGAPYNDGNGNASGHVRVYKRDTNEALGWKQLGGDINGEVASDQSGSSVSLSSDGTILAIGAPYNDGNGSNSGHIRVFIRDTNEALGWKQLGGDINGEAANDFSGFSVSLSSDGTILAIGVSENDGNGTNSGHVRVFIRDTNEALGWKQLGGDINGEAAVDFSGKSVSLSSDGTIVAIGAINNDGNGTDSGHVRVFMRDTNEALGWRQLGGDINGEAAYDLSGWSVSLSSDGTIVAIGAHYNAGNGSNSGHVRVYMRDPTKTTAQLNQSLPNFGPIGWTRLGGDINGEAAFDYSGRSVSLSSDGTILAIGAPYNDGNGSNAGHVRVYKRDTNVALGWRQLGGDIDGEAANDFSGSSVSLSSNGNIVAIGAPLNDGNGTDSGHVRVFKFE